MTAGPIFGAPISWDPARPGARPGPRARLPARLGARAQAHPGLRLRIRARLGLGPPACPWPRARVGPCPPAWACAPAWPCGRSWPCSGPRALRLVRSRVRPLGCAALVSRGASGVRRWRPQEAAPERRSRTIGPSPVRRHGRGRSSLRSDSRALLGGAPFVRLSGQVIASDPGRTSGRTLGPGRLRVRYPMVSGQRWYRRPLAAVSIRANSAAASAPARSATA